MGSASPSATRCTVARPAHECTNALPDVRRNANDMPSVRSPAGRDPGGPRRGAVRRGSCWWESGRATSRTGAACRSSGLPECSQDRYSTTSGWTESVYLTNAVKHFEWRGKRKRRSRDTPSRSEVGACEVWLRAEPALVRPAVLVCHGRTAAQALPGRDARMGELRPAARRDRSRDAGRRHSAPLRGVRAGAARAERRLELVHDLLLAWAAAGKDVSRRREVGSRRSDTQASSKGA